MEAAWFKMEKTTTTTTTTTHTDDFSNKTNSVEGLEAE